MLQISNGNNHRTFCVKRDSQKVRGKGISMIEMLVVVAILAVTLTALLGLITFSLGIQGLVKQTTQANNLAQEAMEAVRSIRDNVGWSQLTDGNHGLTNSAGFWSFSGTGDVINGFTRRISITTAHRDIATSDIVGTMVGSLPDPDTKKITVTVSWSEKGRPHNIELITYFTNWRQ